MELYDNNHLGFIHCKNKKRSIIQSHDLIEKAKYVFENSEEDLMSISKGFFLCPCGQQDIQII